VRGNAGRPGITSIAFRVIWLSRSKVLKRLLELKEYVRRFLQDSDSKLYEHVFYNEWLALRSYLSGKFDKLNRLNNLTEVACNTPLKLKFESLPLPDFWTYIRNDYVELSQLTIHLNYFSTQHACFKNFFSNESN
jgi:hypothetical protein